ncbi:hypothetical protein E2C01_085617 [Portunus trituberculatus]|uniref:Uncharacterized protein n=1 Tax=Portunus trituberculatus TaxID=210409 RepID=A0A5B7IYL0_PORTR|nr:hypothetical protein [Portunus trituberculatus]
MFRSPTPSRPSAFATLLIFLPTRPPPLHLSVPPFHSPFPSHYLHFHLHLRHPRKVSPRPPLPRLTSSPGC